MSSFNDHRDFKESLLADREVMTVLTRDDIERAFDLRDQFRHVDEIFDRVFERIPHAV
jgi:adenylosuccinate lyase